MKTHIIQASLLNPKSGKLLAQIALESAPIRADQLISASGSLQGFSILSGKDELQAAWFNQEDVLLRTGNLQQRVKIITYPSDGENQGHLDLIPGTKEYCQVEEPSQPRTTTRRGLAMIQAILGS